MPHLKSHVFTSVEGARLILELPAHWETVKTKAPVALRDTVAGTVLQVTPFPRAAVAMDSENVRGILQQAAAHELFSSVESSVELQPIQSDGVSGYYYSVQDRRPKPGEWAFKTSGLYIAVGRLLSFTILSHKPGPEGPKEALDALLGIEIVDAER
jgi:hypothetical protein